MDKTRIRSTLWTLMKHTCQMNFTVGSCHQTIRSLSAVHYCHGGNKHSSHLPTTQKQQCFVQPCATLLSNIHSHSRHWLQYRCCHTSVLHHQYYPTVFIDSVPRLHLHRRCYRSVTDQSRMKSPQSKQTNVLVDKDWAKKIVSVLKEHFDVSLPNTVIFDSNAGECLLRINMKTVGKTKTNVCLVWQSDISIFNHVATVYELHRIFYNLLMCHILIFLKEMRLSYFHVKIHSQYVLCRS